MFKISKLTSFVGHHVPKDVCSRLRMSHDIDIKPCRISSLDVELRSMDCGSEVMYDLRTGRNSLGCSCLAACHHSRALEASQDAVSHGNVDLSSKADIHSDWENRTACCVSHMKHKKATLMNVSSQGLRLTSRAVPLALFNIHSEPPLCLKIARVWVAIWCNDCLTVTAAYETGMMSADLQRPRLNNALD